MDGLTDEPFRLLQCQIAKPDVIFTEFVSAGGLAHGAVKLFDHLLYQPQERPIIAQLFGKDPDSFYHASQIICHLGFDGIDINMGCPAKTVVQHGSGASLINQPALASEIIKAVYHGVGDYAKNQKLPKIKQKTNQVINRNLKYSRYSSHIIPTISVKTRLGITESEISTWIPHLLKHNLDLITIHGRTLKQGYSGQADWGQIALAVQLASGSPTAIWGNGDVSNRQQALDHVAQYNVRGVLIGRAALGNPWAFVSQTPTPADKFHAMVSLAQLSVDLFPNRRFDCLRQHFLYYASGLKNAKKLRYQLVRASTVNDLLATEGEFA